MKKIIFFLCMGILMMLCSCASRYTTCEKMRYPNENWKVKTVQQDRTWR